MVDKEQKKSTFERKGRQIKAIVYISTRHQRALEHWFRGNCAIKLLCSPLRSNIRSRSLILLIFLYISDLMIRILKLDIFYFYMYDR